MSHRRRQRQTVRPRLEHLENRLVLSTAIPSTSAKNLLSLGESYVAGDLKINLDRRPDEFAIAVNSGTVSSLLAGTPLLSGYTIERELTSTIAILRRGAINTAETTKVTPFDPAHPESLVGLVSGVSWVSPLYQSSYSNTWMVATNEVIVALKPGQSASDFFASDSRFTGFRPLLGTNDQYVGTVAAGAGAASVGLASDLTNDARLAWVSPNFYQDFRKFATPNDPLYADQWHLNNTGQAGGTAGEDVDAPLAWDVETGNSNTVISIVDDGMEFTHPDISPNLYVNSAEIANGIDDDGNGWIDDFNGWDFTGTGDNNPGPSTVDDAHATSVAGVAAGRGNNGIGVTGASQLASIVPVRIFLGGSPTSDANIASAVNYAAGRTANGLGTWLNVSAMNNSWGGGSPSAAITAAFTWASNNARGGLGTATFIASGNDFSSAVSYPSSLAGTLPGVMAVGASTNVATRSTYSNYGAQLSFVAPSSGVTYGGTADITTTDRVGNNGYNAAGTGDGDPLADTNYTSVFGGTSSATPLSVGIGALVLSRAADLGISLTAAQVKGLLQNTTEYIGPASVSYNATTGFNVEYGYGRINANNAVRGVGVREIQVLDGRTNVADGSTVSLGTLVLPGSVDRIFRIRNQGTLPLDLSSLAISGSSDFTIQTGFGSSTLAVGQTTTFVVRFAPTTRGSKSAVVTFSTNDGDEGSYDITLNAQAQIATISGRVFEDWNGSGVLDPNDVALAGRTVYLDLNNNGSLDYPAIASGPINVSIPDNSPAGVATNLNVSGLAGTVTDVNVTVNITHTWDSDVRLVLRSPTGVLVTLVDGRGGSGDNFTNTTFDDQATTSIAAGSAPFTGSFTPEQPLSAFNGIVPNGTWTLLAYDSVSSDVGVIQNWSLTITTTASDPSTTTDATGAYRFAGLPVGTYTVRSVAPAGWTSVNAQTVIVPDLDTLFPNRDLGQVRQNALYTSEFNDINGDGTRGGAEPGAPGWTVYIDTNNNGALDSTTNTIASGNVNTPIPDNNATGITSTLNVNGLNTPLTDINVVLNINHTWVGDLNISLKGPNNVTIPLILRRGSSGDNFTGTILDDQAATSITSVTSGNAPFTGSWRPEQPLAGFNGINPNGTWSLLISDVVSSDTGTLLNWSLVITSGEAGQTTDSLGNTRFDNLPAGTHNVRQVDKVGWKPTTPAGGSTGGTLVAGGTVNAAPFGNIADSTAPQVQSIVLVTPSPTNAASVSWTVTFTEPVVGLSLSNFALVVGGLSGTSLSGLSGSGSVYTVSASTGTGSGTLGLNLANASGVKDLAQNPVSNAPFTGQVYTIDRTAPAVVEYRVLFGTKSFDVLSSGRVNLPWQITGIQVLFSEPIAAATLGSLTGIAATGFTGLGTNLLTWSFPAISLGTFNTALLGSTGNAIGDAAGNALGNGSGFARTLKVVYGDVNDDGQVNAADLVLASLATSQPYNIFADANGDGVVDSQDVQLIRRRIGTKLS